MYGSPLSSKWTICNKPQPEASFRLFCFSFAGGGASAFRAWPEHLPDHIELQAVQLPGRENRIAETLRNSLEPLVEELADELSPLFEKPFAFFGHSMGSLLAFYLARELRLRGKAEPLHLFVGAHRAPHLPLRRQPIHPMPQDELVSEIRKFQGTDERILNNADLMEMLIPIIRSDFRICETYSHSEGMPLEYPLTAFAAEDDNIALEDIELWREHAGDSFSMKIFSGGHFFLNSNSNRHKILSHIVKQLGKPKC